MKDSFGFVNDIYIIQLSFNISVIITSGVASCWKSSYLHPVVTTGDADAIYELVLDA